VINLTIEGAVARVTLDHPERHNALTRSGLEQLHEHLQQIENDAGLRVLVVTGAGDRTFCSGASLDQVQAGAVDGEAFQAVADRLAALPIPKLAAMNGSAYGGGAELGLCCDFRYGVEGMKLRVPAASFGLCYPPAGIRRYVSRLGVDSAKRILVAAEPFEAAELLRIGYLHRVCNGRRGGGSPAATPRMTCAKACRQRWKNAHRISVATRPNGPPAFPRGPRPIRAANPPPRRR
jgi:enoyl-CoA hydratase/carnithine racemase